MKHTVVQDSLTHSNAKAWRGSVIALVTGLALCAGAAAGAWVHARFYSQSPMALAQEHAITGQVSRDSEYIRQNISVLASKVGELQAKMIAMDGLSRRVADAAGVAYTEPEIQASLDQGDSVAVLSVMDDIRPGDSQEWTAESIGRQLDALSRQITAQEDGFAMLDLLMTRRAGVEASLPSLSPVDYPYLSSSFGWRRNPVTGRHAMHEGLDFAAPKGAPIYAASGGVVTQAGVRRGYGKMVEVTHGNGLTTRYAHASAIKVKEGDLVEKGQVIALVGSSGRSTGAHLHFEVRMAEHPLDPTLFLPPQQSAERLIVDAADHLDAAGPQVR